MQYEYEKPSETPPLIGVNTFRNPWSNEAPQRVGLARSTDAVRVCLIGQTSDAQFIAGTQYRRSM